jgi:hypothetical protein
MHVDGQYCGVVEQVGNHACLSAGPLARSSHPAPPPGIGELAVSGKVQGIVRLRLGRRATSSVPSHFGDSGITHIFMESAASVDREGAITRRVSIFPLLICKSPSPVFPCAASSQYNHACCVLYKSAFYRSTLNLYAYIALVVNISLHGWPFGRFDTSR